MKVLLVDDDDSIRQLCSLVLDNCFALAQVYECGSGNQAISVLKENNDFDFIISDYNMPNGNGGELFQFWLKSKLEIPFLLHTTEEGHTLPEFIDNKDHPLLDTSLAKPLKMKDFKEAVLSILNERFHKDLRQYPPEKKKKIRLLYFYRFNKVLCDVYLKLNEDKYIKIINKGDHYTKEDISKYVNKDIEFLYIQPEDYEQFCSTVADTPFLIEDKSLSPKEVENALENTTAIIHGLVKSVGVGPQVMRLVDASMENIQKTLKNSKFLSTLLSKIRGHKNYLYDHSYLTAYVSTAICDAMNWNSLETQQKLVFTSLLHDSILEDPDIALAMDLQLPELAKYSEEEIEKFKQHPDEITQLVREAHTSDVPPNIDTILEQHHEKPEQNGYPKGLGASAVTQLAAIFVVAHSFVNELYRAEFNSKEMPRIMGLMKQRFKVGNFKGPFEGLQKVQEKIARG